MQPWLIRLQYVKWFSIFTMKFPSECIVRICFLAPQYMPAHWYVYKCYIGTPDNNVVMDPTLKHRKPRKPSNYCYLPLLFIYWMSTINAIETFYTISWVVKATIAANRSRIVSFGMMAHWTNRNVLWTGHKLRLCQKALICINPRWPPLAGLEF